MISRTPLNRLPLSKRAFFGFIVMDGQTNKVLKYQYANDPRVKSIDVVSDKLIVNYFLPVWSYKTDQLLRGRKLFIKPSKVYYKLEGNLKGRPYFDSSNMYACFSNNQVTRPVILKIKDNL